MATDKKFSHVLVAADGSKPSLRAVETAGVIAAGLGVPVVVVAVASQRDDMPAELLAMNVSRNDVAEARTKAAEKFAEQAKSTLPGQEVEIKVIQGDPAECIIRTTRQYPAPLLVLGRRGLTGFRELVMGSVSHKVVQYADCPVMVVN